VTRVVRVRIAVRRPHHAPGDRRVHLAVPIVLL